MNLFIKILFLFLIFINVNNSTLILRSVSSWSQVQGGYTFVFTPFFPIRKQSFLSLRFTSTRNTTATLTGTLSLYSDLGTLVKSKSATFTIEGDSYQPGTSTSGPVDLVYISNNNDPKYKSLKASQIANYTSSFEFEFPEIMNPQTNSLYSSYYFEVSYTDEDGNDQDTYTDMPIVFPSPAYNSTLESSIIKTNSTIKFDGYGQEICKQATIVQLESGKSNSYGLYFHENQITQTSDPLKFIKSKDSYDYYYYYNEYTSAQSVTTLYDGLTGQQRTIESNLNCVLPNAYLLNSINTTLVSVEGDNGFSAYYSVVTSTNKIDLIQLGLNPVAGGTTITLPTKPITFYNAKSNLWTHLLRIASQYSKVYINIASPPFSNYTYTTSVTQTDMVINCVYSPVSNVFYKNLNNANSKYTYDNRQIQVLVECNTVGAISKINSIDFESGGTIFFADREIFNIATYSKLITIPDKFITYGSGANYLTVYLNYPIVGRSLVKKQDLSIVFREIVHTSLIGQASDLIETNKATTFYNPVTTRFTTSNNFITPQFNLQLLNRGGFTTYSKFAVNNGDGVNFQPSFPQSFTGYSNGLNWKPSLPIPLDTPASLFSVEGSLIDSNINFVANPYLIRDFVNPSVTAKFIFSTDPLIEDEIIVSVSDKIGTSSNNCHFTFATHTFSLAPGNAIKHIDQNNNVNNIDYSFKLKFNKYYCVGSTLPVIDCSDIRGNRIYESNFSTTEIQDLFFTGLKSCPIQSVPQARVLTNFINFQTRSNVAVNILLGDVESLEMYEISVSIYGDYENVEPVLQSQILTKSNYNIDTRTMVASGVISFNIDSNTLTSTKYISITVTNIQSPDIKFTLSTRDLEYLDSKLQVLQTTTTVVHSKFTIKNQAYVGDSTLLKNLVLVKWGSGVSPVTCRLSANTGISNIYNFTVLIKDKFVSTTQKMVISALDPTTYFAKDTVSIQFNLPSHKYYYVNVFIDNICDHFNNCFDLSPFANTSTEIDFGTTPSTTTSTYTSAIGTPSFSRNYIDSSSANRKVKISVDLKINNTITNSGNLPFELSYGGGIQNQPVFYIGEKQSGDQLKCPLIQSATGSSVYTCDLEIPLYWGGVRYVGQCGIWNIIHPDGYLTGKVLPVCPIFLFKQELPYPNVWEISAKMGDTQLMVSGTNLDLIPQNIKSEDLSLFTSSTFTVLNNTMGYYQLKNEVTAPFTITIGSRVISVFIITCMKPDCSGHGTCSKTVCSCMEGWGGSDCSIDTTFKCLNNCNGKGTCSIDMVCNCNSGYTGVDCNVYSPDIGLSMGMNTSKTEPTINLGQFGANSTELNQYTRQSNFSILIPYIQEIDFYGNLVTNYTFTPSSWFLVESNATFTIYNTTLTENSNFTVTLETITTETTREWAGQLLNLPANSIKYSVRIQNYTFSSNLNTLQMVYQATPGSEVLTDCQIKQKIAWGAKVPTDMHWVTIPNNQVSLYGRFSNNMIADDRIISTSNEGLEFGTTIQVKVNIPFFKTYIELDPDFSVLVNSDDMDNPQYDECGIVIENNENNRKWVLPVAIVVSVVGAAVIVAVLMTLLYTKNTNVRTRLLSFKSKMSKSRGNITMK